MAGPPDSRHPHSFLYGVSGLPSFPRLFYPPTANTKISVASIWPTRCRDHRSLERTGLTFRCFVFGLSGIGKTNEYRIWFFDDFSQDDNFILVDPVLGDHGKLYPGMDTGMITGCANCVKSECDHTQPDEAAFLLDGAISSHPRPKRSNGVSLSKLGPEYVIITSAPSGNEKVATLAYNKNDERLAGEQRLRCSQLSGYRWCFASVITGCLLNGDSLPEAIERAVHFINMGIKATFGYAHNPLDGMNQEKCFTTWMNPALFHLRTIARMIKAIITDLDGTLLPRGGSISADTLEAFG